MWIDFIPKYWLYVGFDQIVVQSKKSGYVIFTIMFTYALKEKYMKNIMYIIGAVIFTAISVSLENEYALSYLGGCSMVYAAKHALDSSNIKGLKFYMWFIFLLGSMIGISVILVKLITYFNN